VRILHCGIIQYDFHCYPNFSFSCYYYHFYSNTQKSFIMNAFTVNVSRRDRVGLMYFAFMFLLRMHGFPHCRAQYQLFVKGVNQSVWQQCCLCSRNLNDAKCHKTFLLTTDYSVLKDNANNNFIIIIISLSGKEAIAGLFRSYYSRSLLII
jgi:hypothetical protein